MVQWIVSMERMASQSHWTGKNRFDSFAPIRLNVAAQWLVDGVSLLVRHARMLD
jgi:phospholipase D1/2